MRTERTIIKGSCPHYNLLDKFCFEAKNLYNYANYRLRQNYKEKYLELHNFYKLRNYLRRFDDEQNPWSRQATTHIGAEVIQCLINAWNSYFSSLKSFRAHPEKFRKAPKPPQYLPKNGRYEIVLDTTNFKFSNETVRFPKVFQGLSIPFNKADKIQAVRVIPKQNHFIIEVVYKMEVPKAQEDNGRYLSIDLGVDNFAAITSNVAGFQSVVLNGKGLKSINQWYNKQKAHYQQVAKQMNGIHQTDRLIKLASKRNFRMKDMLHKMSRYIITLADEYNCSHIVIGYNPSWKDQCGFGAKTNQNFVQLPYLCFIQQVMYKAENQGRQMIVTEESYTSMTSFLDGEFPEKQENYKGRRSYRGLYQAQNGVKINADINGSYQILKKVFPNAYSNGIEGVSLHPIRVDIA